MRHSIAQVLQLEVPQGMSSSAVPTLTLAVPITVEQDFSAGLQCSICKSVCRGLPPHFTSLST